LSVFAGACQGQLKTLRQRLVSFLIQQNAQELKISKLMDELASIKDRILNPGSHGAPVPLYGQELKEAIGMIEQLHQLLKPVP